MMTGDLTLACLLLAVTIGEQIYLASAVRSWQLAFGLSTLYGLGAWLLTGSAGVAIAIILAGIALRGLARVLTRDRGVGPWTAAADVVAPYLAPWIAWAWLHPAVPAAIANGVAAVWSRVTLAAAPSVAAPLHAFVIIGAYVFCGGTATHLTRSILAVLNDAGVPAAAATVREAAAAAEPVPSPQLRAGRLIGELERFLTLTLVLTGHYDAVGFVIAAKSVARFEMIRVQAEYFLVGTLTSIGLAFGVGLLAVHLLQV